MPPRKKNSTSSTASASEWYQKPITKISGAIMGIAALIGLGFKIGDFYRDIHAQTEINDERLKHDKELRDQMQACNEMMQSYQNQRVDALEAVVKEFQKQTNGRKQR
jgi:hypothetical protein